MQASAAQSAAAQAAAAQAAAEAAAQAQAAAAAAAKPAAVEEFFADPANVRVSADGERSPMSKQGALPEGQRNETKDETPPSGAFAGDLELSVRKLEASPKTGLPPEWMPSATCNYTSYPPMLWTSWGYLTSDRTQSREPET